MGFMGSQFSGAGIDLETAYKGNFYARLELNTAVSVKLAVNGNTWFDVNGMLTTINPGLLLSTADNLIDATGLDAGVPMSASTLYNVYVSNAQATDFPSTYRASATAPSVVNGVNYLGAAGNALNWRFIGWVGTDAVTQFADDDTNRQVVNFYNRRLKRILLRPAYVDNNAQTVYVLNTAVWARVNAGVGDTCSFISNGQDPIDLSAHVTCLVVGAGAAQFGIGLDSNTSPTVAAAMAAGAANISVSARLVVTPATAAIRTATLLGLTGGVGSTIIADQVRAGAAADPPATFLIGWVPC